MYNLRRNFNLSILKQTLPDIDLSRGVMLQQIKHWNTLPRDIRSMAGSKDFFEKDSCLMHFYLYSIAFSSFLNFNLINWIVEHLALKLANSKVSLSN